MDLDLEIALLAESIEDLQALIAHLEKDDGKFGLKISQDKTKS